MTIAATARRTLELARDRAAGALLEGRVRTRLAAANTGAPDRFDCVVYFADDPGSAYQLRQWLAPLAELAKTHPTAVLVHKPTTAAALLPDSPLPVFLTTGIGQVEEFVDSHRVRLVFYVNNNRDNFTVLRLAGPRHVHLSHGESDKISMASNQLKAYDYAFIAGAASRERILGHLRRMDPAKLVEIGRPQLDTPVRDVRAYDGGRTTVLYAPTWEGDRPAMAYGSAASHGTALVAALLADPRYRLIFRPHPRTGVRVPEHRAAVRHITGLIKNAQQHPGAGHYLDTRRDVAAAMAEADACICDISAVAMDCLPLSKRLLVTRPVDPEAEIQHNGITAVVPLLDATDAEDVPNILAGLLSQPLPKEQTALVEHYFGDTAPGAGTRRFLDAVEKVLQAG
ncbi:CDP-glycerol glycerophosphotransferase family protein [Arthrobacter sulfonylureivorans]|uniref:CDP-glycerol glycerophosphotransferase family protein n=1 Tax=Arthrobacter sulfonylureivorans TaxID=2486855 RepID=A0ABY3WAR8_9MICC|nr:CDP-glycerol glycerophosphotransferase family protein [Arthrobacter sulfonylureivorans]UNK47454.1 CDP-glycerol glycerophosphotransferase family protein [Arthrobacter sulfonylureivorans]